MAVRVEEEVGWLDVTVQEVCGVHEIKGLEKLVDDILLVDVLKDVRPDDRMEVGF